MPQRGKNQAFADLSPLGESLGFAWEHLTAFEGGMPSKENHVGELSEVADSTTKSALQQSLIDVARSLGTDCFWVGRSLWADRRGCGRSFGTGRRLIRVVQVVKAQTEPRPAIWILSKRTRSSRGLVW